METVETGKLPFVKKAYAEINRIGKSQYTENGRSICL
jgi:hypothetical protein